MKNTEEIRRLLGGPRDGESPAGRLVRLRVSCVLDAPEVLRAGREIWAAALWQPDPRRLSLAEWRLVLPRWFAEKFDPDPRVEDPLLRRAFLLQERMRPADAWT